MIENTLGTMNLWLAVTAVVSIVEVLLVIAAVIGGYLAYRRVVGIAGQLELSQVAPMISHMNAILEDVNSVTTRVRERTRRVDRAISGAVGLVNQTGRRVEVNLRPSVWGTLAVLVGVLAAFTSIVRSSTEYAVDPAAEQPQ